MISEEELEETSELEKTVWFLQYSPYTEALSVERLVKETKKDHTLRELKKSLRRGRPSELEELAPYRKIWDQLTLSDSGLVLTGDKIVLPECLLDEAIRG